MKKIILTLIAVVLSAGIMSAQDMAQATETYNSGATALSDGNKAAALEHFMNALKQAAACGEEGEEIVANCKGIIPTIQLSLAKDLIKDANYDAAIAKLAEATGVATEYGADDVIAEAAELLPQVKMQKANTLYNAKDFAAAAEAYKEVLAGDAENGNAALRLAMALNGAGDTDAAIAAFEKAATLGQEANANKQLANIFLKDAAAQLKAKNYTAALEAAVKVNEYSENAQAYLVAGQASQQLKKNNDAIEYFEKYLELSPSAKNANAITFTVAALYQGLGNKAKALENYNKVASDAQYGASAKQQIEALNK